ncbi:MAG TPA: NADH-quinone oxidoreductase subunit NuoH [Anaerolineae bacterium]|nr:NADH-quinone oxidoreductase subunit NuoH [Anaerolineae bacterium]
MDPFSSIAVALENLLASLGFADWLIDLIMAVLRSAILGTVALLAFMFLTWLERKLIGRMQDRLGPTYAGPIGILQPIADGIKTLTKEIVVPKGADRWIYFSGPILAAMAALAVFAVIPFGPDTGNGPLVGTALNVGLVYVLAAGAAGIVATIMAGWGSNNKFAVLGTFRAVAQLISYEVPQLLSLVAVAMVAGTMDMVKIVDAQTVPFIFPLFVTALLFLISGVAESGRSPFDLLEADSEIVAGFHIEYSAMMFALVQMAEYIHAFAISCIVVTVFLNGWAWPFLPGLAPIWFLVKCFAVFFILIWFRGTLPRFRIDQMMAFNWQFMVPLALVNVIVVAVVDRALSDAAGWTSASQPWGWGLVMFAANAVMLLAALGLMSLKGREARMRDAEKARSQSAVAATGR